MPRYHFDVIGGLYGPDLEGTELPGWKAARAEALRLAGELLREAAHGDSLDEELHIDVTDEAGVVLFRLDFFMEASSEVPRAMRLT